MKKLLIVLAGLMLATTAQAAPYVGGSLGYLYDLEEPIYFGRLGYEFDTGGIAAHGFEAELGYTSLRGEAFGIRADADLLPVMANYRGSAKFGNSPVSLYYGGGIGGTYYDATVGAVAAAKDWTFSAQGFAGLEVFFNEFVSMTGGARYIFFDDYDAEVGGRTVTLDSIDDIAFEVGLTIRF